MRYQVAIIGLGYWGSKLLDFFYKNPGFDVKVLCDRNAENRAKAELLYPMCVTFADPANVFKDPSIQVVVISTQASTHFDLCYSSLSSGKHVFVEKPFVLTSKQAITLSELSIKVNKKIFVDHTFLFTPGYQKLKTIVANNEYGNIYRIMSERTDFGLFQKDVNVLWHLMYHDIYILTDLLNTIPDSAICREANAIVTQFSDGACAIFQYPDNIQATVFCDMYFPYKSRRFIVQFERGIVEWNETSPTPLVFYKRSASYQQEAIQYFGDGSRVAIDLQCYSALTAAIDAFHNQLESNMQVPCDEVAALKVVKIIEGIFNA